jgi:hypothetical protein
VKPASLSAFQFIHRGVVTLGLSIVATFVAVVSCGPQGGGQATVKVGAPEPVVTPFSQCKEQISRYTGRVDGAKPAASGEAGPMKKICEVSDPDIPRTLSEDGNPVKPFIYQATDVPLRYSVSTVEGRLEIYLKLGVDVPESLSKEDSDIAMSLLKSVCVEQIKAAWDAKSLGVDIHIDLESTRVESFDANSADQILYLTDSGLSDASLIMFNWPDRGALYLHGRKTEVDKCINPNEKAKCKAIERAASNQKFCRSFSRNVGQWLGLDAQEIRDGKCTAPVKAQTTPANPSEKKTDSNFMQDAKFKGTDVRTILGPACKGADLSPVKSAPAASFQEVE